MNANSRRARAAAEASEWWIRIESRELSREEREQLVDWLRESAVHVEEMLRRAEIHGALERFTDWAAIPTDDPSDDNGPQACGNVVAFPPPGEPSNADESSLRAPRIPRKRLMVGLALAATVAVLGVFLTLFLSAQVIETGRAERRSVTLADGSIVQLDPESRLSIRLRKHERDVSLEHGRALFRVAKDPSRPFVVRADATQVRAVGTQFGVEQSREGVVVTVAEGKVAVGSDRPPGSRSGAVESSASAEVLLSAGQQVIVTRRGSAEAVRTVDTDRELAWVAGRLVFDNDSVADVVEEFNRYNVVQIHVASPELGRRSVSGVFDASEPESFIGFMQSVAPVNVRRAGQDITIALAP
jgi:transmembrane sensor